MAENLVPKDDKPRYKALRRVLHPVDGKYYEEGDEINMDHRKESEIKFAIKQGWIAIITPDKKGS